jgi:hypothetical protein
LNQGSYELGEKKTNDDYWKIDQDSVVRSCSATGWSGNCPDAGRVSSGRECPEEYETVFSLYFGERREVDTSAVCGPGDAGASCVHAGASGAGKFVVVGPALDEGRIRGMAIINAASMEEAKKIVNGDKMIQSGHFVAEIHPVMLADLSALHTEYPAKTTK